jgi:hypothetical protein
MPPRHAYWTILIDDKPTAFRARERAELLPTFHQLQRKNSNVVMKWFARGRLWDTQEAEREDFQRRKRAGYAPAAPGREARTRDWRPGGAHKDPRDRFKKKPKDRPEWRSSPARRERKPWQDRPQGPPRGDRPWAGKPSSGPPRRDRPWNNNKPTGDRPWGNKPRGDRPWSNKPPRPGQGRGAGERPRGDRPWSTKPPRPEQNRGAGDRPWSNKPGHRKPWGGKPANRPPWRAKPAGPSSSPGPDDERRKKVEPPDES